MGLGDFINALGKAGGKGRGQQSAKRSQARVKDFNRDELENAAESMQQSAPGALDNFLDNLGSAFRPAGTFAAASIDAIGGDGATTNLVKQVREGSKVYKQSGVGEYVKRLPIVGETLDASLNAPTGDFSNTLVGKGIDKFRELITGVDPNQEAKYRTAQFDERVARATEDSGFNDVARGIAENRQGQKQDNFVERTLGKVPVVGAYFDKYQPSVEDRAVEAGATPAQAAFISMLNPLEWLNAESKVDAEAKLAKAGTLRKAVNRIASPIVDPVQAGIDWALPGKARVVAQAEDAVVDASKPLAEQAAPAGTFESRAQAFANNLGLNVDDLPVAPAKTLADEAITFSEPLDDFVRAIAPAEAHAPVSALPEDVPAPIAAARAALADPNVGDAVDELDDVSTFAREIPESRPLLPEEVSPPLVDSAPTTSFEYTPASGRGPIVGKVDPLSYRQYGPDELARYERELTSMIDAPPASQLDAENLAALIDEPTTDSLTIGNLAPENPVFAAARRQLQDPNVGDVTTIGDIVGDAEFSTFAKEIPESLPQKVERAKEAVSTAVTDNVRRGAEPGTSVDIATTPAQKAAVAASSVDVDRLAALEASIQAVKGGDLPPVQRKKKLAALQQEVIALRNKLEGAAAPRPSYGMPIAGGLPLPTYQQLQAFKGDITAAWKALTDSYQFRQVLKHLPKESQSKVLGRVVSYAEAEKGAWRYLSGEVEMFPSATIDDILGAAKTLDGEIEKARVAYPNAVFGGLPLPTSQHLAAFKSDLGALAKKFADNTVELRASLSRWFSSTSLGKVDAKTTAAIRDGAEASDAFSRTLADAYHKVVNGNIAGVLGSKHGGVYNLTPAEKVAIRDFMGGRVSNGVKVDEAALQAMGIPQDVIDTSKLVRGMMDQTSDALMAETFNLPLAWFTKLNDEDRAIVAGLAQTASKPKARASFEKTVDPAKLQVLNDARQKVDDGFAELNAAGHWLDGEDPRDMLLAWAPYLSNRGTYQPLLYRLFEHGVLSKGDDAMQLYIQTLRGKGVNVPDEVEAFLYSNWMAGGAKTPGFGNELDRIKKRNPNMPQAIKELLQEIEDPAYSYATGLFQVNRLRHQLALRRWMSGQEKFVSRPGESVVDFMARNGWKNGEVVQLGDNVGANTRNFGAMAGRFVHRDFWDLAFQVHALPGTAGGADMFMKFNKEVLQRWKFWHTVANPASHIRQGVQNLTSVYLAGGVSGLANMPAAVKEYKSRGKFFAMARENGLLGNKSLHDIAEKIDDSAWKHLDFNAAESFIARMGRFGEYIAGVSQGFRSGSETKRFSGKWAAAKWQLVDEVARIALLKTYIDRGWDVKKAAEAVKGEVYGGVKRSRIDGMIAGIPPSSTFADLGADGSLGALGIKAASLASQAVNIPFWGASRFILEQSLRNFTGMKPGTWMPLTDPGRMARTMALVMAGYGLHKMAQTAEGMEPADEVAQRPDYMRPYLPMHARVPSQIMELIDDKGKVGYHDLSWALPWGGLASGGFDPKTGKMTSRGISSELVQVSPLWKPLGELYFNKDSFRAEIGARSEIYNPLDTTASKARKSAAHLWRSYLPPWAPNLGGGVVDALRYDGGADERVDAKEAMRAFFQGVASDSGHTASKLASGIYNSFDYWWAQKFPDGQERIQVSDYMGREQYLVKSLADALAIKVTSTDLKQIQKRRESAQTLALKEMKHYYQQQRSNTTNPSTIRRLRNEEAEFTRQIKQGKPVAKWYDESPADTWMNVRNFFAEKLSR